MARDHDLAGRDGKIVAQSRRAEQSVQTSRQLVRSAGSDQQPGFAIGDEFGEAARIGCDHRYAAGLCLQDAQPERL